MGKAKAVKKLWCHYCGARATTRDHVVPRSLLVDYTFQNFVQNIVPACYDCNQAKKSLRSDCRCEICLNAWRTLGPVGWEEIEVVTISQYENVLAQLLELEAAESLREEESGEAPLRQVSPGKWRVDS